MCHDRRMELTFLGGARTVTGFAPPRRHRPGQGPHRLRHVPGRPRRDDAQPRAAGRRPGDARRGRPDPRPPRPLRPPAAARPRGLPRRDRVHRGHRRARAARAARLGQAPGGVRQARGPPRAGATPDRAAARRRAQTPTDYDEVAPASPPRAPRARAAPTPRSCCARPGPEVVLHLGDPLYTEDDVDLDAVDVPDRSRTAWSTRSRRASTSRSPTPATSSARRSCGCGSRGPAAAATRSSCSRATSAGPARRSSATRRRSTEGDFVLCESTYGGREHEPAEAGDRRRWPTSSTTRSRRKGVLLIPSFAIGRTQEIVWELSRLLDAGRIPELPVYLDSPMAKSASEVYRAHPEAYDEETGALLRGARGAARLPGPAHRPERPGVGADRAGPAAVRDRRLERDAHRRPVRGPRGAAARRPVGDRPVRGLPGRGHARRPPRPRRPDRRGSPATRCRSGRPIRSLDGFSAHADEPELLDWLGGFIGGRRAGRPGRAARRLPRPRRPAGPGGAAAQGRRRSASTPRSPPGTRRCRWTDGRAGASRARPRSARASG